MKHKAFRWIPAVLLAALLAGCGARAAASARPAGSRELKSTPPDSMHATAAITEQYTLEKVVQAENGGKVRLNIHLPRLESDSADAARINAEIARLYEYDVQEYADCPAAADPDVWDICIEMNWNASWYGDCVSLVVSSCYGGTDAPFYQGWCFDFESGNQLTATQLLQRMGADPAALEEALYRDVKRRDELDRQAHEILQKEFPDDEDIPGLALTDITIDKSGCYGTFSLCYDTGDSPAGELYLNVSFDEQFVPSPKVGYDTF